LIPYAKHHIDEEDIQAVVDILKSGWLTQGPAIDVFEKSIAEYVGAKYAVAVTSGTAALHIATLAAGLAAGDTLVTSPITFVASANAALYAGANVVFADIDKQTINISPIALKKVLEANPDTRVVIPVHFAGLPCDMSAIKSIADGAKAHIIEDAAHALGATYTNGKRVGSCSHSLMTIFSFHPVKAIASGEGGMITTNNENIYRKLLRLRGHGINKLNDPFQLSDMAMTNGIQNPWYYEMQEIGFNYRITDIQCGLALSQFKKIDRFISRRKNLVKVYKEHFSGMKNCSPAQVEGQELSGHHIFVLRIDFDAIGLNRGELIRALKSKGIGSQVHYIPVPAHPYYQKLGFKPEQYPNAWQYYQEALSIPLYYDLTDDEQNYVISVLKEFLA